MFGFRVSWLATRVKVKKEKGEEQEERSWSAARHRFSRGSRSISLSLSLSDRHRYRHRHSHVFPRISDASVHQLQDAGNDPRRAAAGGQVHGLRSPHESGAG